jgi:acetylornithine/N-succinyldiaminopimelate aminotransferase
MEKDGLLQRAAQLGQYLGDKLRQELGQHPGVKEIRAHGLMIGIELAKPCSTLIGRAAEAGLLISVTADSVIRLLPPLIITQAEIDELLARLLPLVREFLAEA